MTALKGLGEIQSVKPQQTRGELPEAECIPGGWAMEKNKAEEGIRNVGGCNIKFGGLGAWVCVCV